jgi:suppressor of fused
MSADDSAPGWDAIDVALSNVYGDQRPLHWAPPLHYAVGGSDPLDGISAYRRASPVPHWHFVTYGFSELYRKESPDAEVSGFGFELTLRVMTMADSAPGWAFDFLQNLARYVFSSGNTFLPGHYMNLNSPMALGHETTIWGMAITSDPELPPIDTPHGRIQFLQVVGVSVDELLAMKAWNCIAVLDLLRPRLPLLVTDLDRPSFTDDKEIACAVKAGSEKEGSSTAFLFVGAADWRIETSPDGGRVYLTLGANGVRDFRVVLPGRIPHGHDLAVSGKDKSIAFIPSERCSWTAQKGGQMAIYLTSEAAKDLATAVQPKRGKYAIDIFPGLSVEVVPSEIKNARGEVVEVVG